MTHAKTVLQAISALMVHHEESQCLEWVQFATQATTLLRSVRKQYKEAMEALESAYVLLMGLTTVLDNSVSILTRGSREGQPTKSCSRKGKSYFQVRQQKLACSSSLV